MGESAHRLRLGRLERISLLILSAFTIVAIAGYAVFGLHPEILDRLPGLSRFYAPAFVFFAQGHVWTAGAILAIYLARKVGLRWLPAFLVLYAASLLSELVGTSYSVPFGTYHYSGLLGSTWFGRVPWIIPLSWFSMAVPSYVLARHRFPADKQRIRRMFTAALLLLAWDLALDPAMSHLTSYWVWEEAGVYYGMPLVNLLGWYGTGIILMLLLEALGADRWAQKLSGDWMAAYYALVLLMPYGMVLAAGLWGAATTTALAVGAIGWVVGRQGLRSGQEWSRAAALQTAPDANGVRSSVARLAITGGEVKDAFFWNHSRSFALTTHLLPRRERRLIGSLYAFCRTTDDLVDQRTGSSRDDVEKELDAWIARAQTAFDGGHSGIQWLDDLMHASRKAGVPFDIIRQLAEGVRMDVGPVALTTVEELDRYAHRVASVVGIWLCHLYGSKDAETLRRAAAMGRAMQLTNILRDVGEDLRQNRVYLPAALMEQFGVSRSDLHAMQAGGQISQEYRLLMEELFTRAEAEYEYAFSGLAAVPPTFARASAAAAAVYRGIHDEIRRNGYDNLRKRAYTGTHRKISLAATGLYRLFVLRRSSKRPSLWHQPAIVRQTSEATTRGTKAGCMVLVCLASLTAPSPSNDVINATAGNPWLTELRNYYLRAVEDRQVLVEAQAAVAKSGRTDSSTRAYAAAFIVLQAKHTPWPHRKVRFLRTGLKELDRLVAEHPQAVEIRYLRLLSCYFIPSFFGREWSVKEDFQALARNLPEAAGSFPQNLVVDMATFILEHGTAAPADRARLEKLLHESVRSNPSPVPATVIR